MSQASTSRDALAAGQAALARNDWQAAHDAFAEAVAAGGGPEADEGLAGAAFWLDRPEAVFDAAERAYAGYRTADRPVDAARMAIALAWYARVFRGETAVSDGWLGRARRLLEGLPPAFEHGWLALREASFALPQDPDRARERCAAAEALGRELGHVDLEMTAVALDGLARVSSGDIAGGMARLDEASAAATAGDMSDPMAIGFSCCYLIFACERVRDLDRVGQWCGRLARYCEATNNRSLLSVCRTHYGTVLVLQGAWDAAEAELSAAAAGLATQPALAADALARLAELRRRQGRIDEAAALAEQAGHHPLAVLCRAALALDRDDPAGAADGAALYLRLIGDARTERALGLEILVEAHAVARRPEAAEEAARELAAIAAGAGTVALLGAARAAEGRARRSAGDGDAAREAFEDGVELLGRAGLPFEVARARVALAWVLAALGRRDAARREATAARDAFAALGAAAEKQRAAAVLSGRGGTLSAREREVLALVAQGLTNAEIAAELVLSEHTVHRHVANILAKLGSPSRAAAAARAGELGLL
jgi:DNA-binding CsgD family transcriptional regulator